MAMAAKTELLAQELNTMKVDLAFAKERCVQLEEENKILRESNEKGVSPEEEDLVSISLSISIKCRARSPHSRRILIRILF